MATTSSFCAFPCGHWQCHRQNLRHGMTRSAAHPDSGGHSPQGIPCCLRDRCTASGSVPARAQQRLGLPEVHPGRGFKTRAQHITRLNNEAILAIDQQPHHLPLGNLDADRPEQRDQTRHGNLTLMILGQKNWASTKRRSSGPKWPSMPSGSGATTVRPSGVTQRSRRNRTTAGRMTRSWMTKSS